MGQARKAQVRLVGTTSKLTISAVTDTSGRFTFNNVPAGEYMVKAGSPGTSTWFLARGVQDGTCRAHASPCCPDRSMKG